MKLKVAISILSKILISSHYNVSAFYILEESLKTFRRCKKDEYRELAACIEGILTSVAKIEKNLYDNDDLEILYNYRTISKYIEDVEELLDGKNEIQKIQKIQEDLSYLRDQIERCYVLISNLPDNMSNVGSYEIDEWARTVKECAFYPQRFWDYADRTSVPRTM